MKSIKYILVFHLLTLCCHTQAQVKTNFNNAELISNKGRFAKEYKTQTNFELSAKDINQLLVAEKKEIEQSNKTKPFQIAVPVSIDLDIAKTMDWTYDNEYGYGKFTIKLNGALSSSINFDQFYLPKGTEMYVYNEDGNMITGPVTENENNPNKIWGSWVYRGRLLTIEIKTPIVTKEQLLLHSNSIAYGYKEMYRTRVGGFSQSGSCNINVLCPEGNGWEPERNSVALGISGDGTQAFSGSMVMNTCVTNRPFFLTANHVYNLATPAQNVTGWRFTFQAWSATCPHPGVNADGVTYNGSTLRATWADSDFCLVELNNTPPTNSGIHYAGWNRNVGPPFTFTNVTGIHHPNGDVMKIARSINAVTRSGGGIYNPFTHWQVSWTQGITAVGSSGSPLFDQNHRIIGQLHGGTSFCATPNSPDWYGSFDQSWTGGGTNTTRLSNWLDPINTGAVTTNTTNVSALFSWNPTLTITGSPATDYICSGSSTYTLNGLPGNAAISWSISNPSIASIPNPSTGSSVVVTKQSDGLVTLTANVTLCGGEIRTVNKSIMVGPAIDGYYRIASDYHNYGIFNPLYNNNSPIWLPANKTFGVEVFLTSPALQSATWTRAATSYPFTWNTSGTFLSFSGTSGASAYVERKGIFNISAQTSCGTFNGVYNWPVIVQGWGSFKITTSPNPANDLITVNISEESPDVKALSSNENVTVEMYSFNQTMLIKTWQFKNDHNQFNLNIADVNKGQYILVVRKGKFKESKQILIE